MSASSRGDLFAKAIGFLVMLVGLAVILGVLWLGFRMFNDPNLGVGQGAAPTATDIGAGFVKLLLRIALLFLGSISGSLIANKGIHLYFTGSAGGASGGTTIVTATQPPSPAPEPTLPPSSASEQAAKRS